MPATLTHPQARRTLFLLWLVFAIAQLDRHILSLSLDAISTEFALSDWQLGLLSGFAFAVVFVLVGFPIAALCTHYSRRNIVAGSVTIWSAFTLVTATAQSFAMLLLARIGVGAGEAGAVAPAHSMISDLFPEDKHASSLSTFATGANFGLLLAALVGGVLGQLYGWRVAMVIAGVPGFVVALALFKFVIEPKKQAISKPQSGLFIAAWLAILQDRGSRNAFLAFMMMGVITFSAAGWVPTHLIRMHGLNVGQAGLTGVLFGGVIGGLGTYVCGQAIDAVGRAHPRNRILGICVAVASAAVFAMCFVLSTSLWLALAFFSLSSFFGFGFWGPTFAFAYSRVAPELRPMVTAFFLFGFNIFGMALGPTLVGALSTGVFEAAGQASIGYGLAMSKVFGLIALWFYWKSARALS